MLKISNRITLPDAEIELHAIRAQGGDGGGRIIAQGSPKDIAANPDSVTGEYLKKVLR